MPPAAAPWAMKDKVVVVTGAFGSLGVVCVQTALSRGAKVAAIDLGERPAGACQGNYVALGGFDLADPGAAGAVARRVVEVYGGVDALLNVVGGFTWQTTLEGDPAAWERLHRLNVITVLHACRAFAPELAKSGGAIVNVGAKAALVAAAGMGAYTAAKAAVHRLTEVLAEELKGVVRVNAVLPSIIDTPQNRAEMPDADPAKWVGADELARVMLFLASDEASGVTGALVPVVGRV